MRHELDDATIEALIRGEQVPRELEPLANALNAIRSAPHQPVRPSPELAARMADGDFASAAVPLSSHRGAGRHAHRRLPALRFRTKVAAGAAIALGGLATATAAGALPGPAQEQVESVIQAITPIEFPDRSDLGREIADDAQDGGVDGTEVSEKAKEQGQQPDAPGLDEQGLPEPAQDRPAVPTPDQTPPVEPADPPGKQGPPVVKPTAPPGDVPPDQPGQGEGPNPPELPDPAD
jgi:hypothetical protein